MSATLTVSPAGSGPLGPSFVVRSRTRGRAPVSWTRKRKNSNACSTPAHRKGA
jgi:hypothetical protein